MGGADDANPMNRSLPAEVVSRRRKVEKKQPPEETPLTLDQRVVLAMKPEQRLKWLFQALQRLQQGKVQSTNIYDIVVHTKFPKDVADKIGLKMYRAIIANISFFSQKQQRFMETESKLAQVFKDKQRIRKERQEGAPSGGGQEDQNVHALMSRLLSLTAAEGQDFMDTLDSSTKDRLEELLEERIRARVQPVGSHEANNDSDSASSSSAGGRSTSRSGGASRRRRGGRGGGGGGRPERNRGRPGRDRSRSWSRSRSRS